MIEIDGSQGEGGGQILRTALALSAICEQPVRIDQIRANRTRPGLRPQHLTGVKAMVELCEAEATGVALGSSAITFAPRALPGGPQSFDIGTAGATSLLLHALYFPMAWGESGGSLHLKGGTHNDMAPTFNYLQEVWLPWLRLCGFSADVELLEHGFYPKGGGAIEAHIPPYDHTSKPEPFHWVERPPLDRIEVYGLLGHAAKDNVRSDIPERMAERAAKVLRRKGYEPNIITEIVPSLSTNAICQIICHLGPVKAGFVAFGKRGKTSEVVGKEVARSALSFLDSDACLEEHIADQVLLPLALSGQSASYTTTRLSGHLSTNANIIQMFLPKISIEFDEHEHGVLVSLRANG